jgi:hypothetical protein
MLIHNSQCCLLNVQSWAVARACAFKEGLGLSASPQSLRSRSWTGLVTPLP